MTAVCPNILFDSPAGHRTSSCPDCGQPRSKHPGLSGVPVATVCGFVLASMLPVLVLLSAQIAIASFHSPPRFSCKPFASLLVSCVRSFQSAGLYRGVFSVVGVPVAIISSSSSCIRYLSPSCLICLVCCRSLTNCTLSSVSHSSAFVSHSLLLFGQSDGHLQLHRKEPVSARASPLSPSLSHYVALLGIYEHYLMSCSCVDIDDS